MPDKATSTETDAIPIDPMPIDPMLPRPFRVVAVRRETEDVVTLHFEPADGGPTYSFGPAQIGMVGLPGLGEVPISFSSAPSHDAHMGMTIRRAGAITGALCDLIPGDVVSMRGPYGTEWPMESAFDRHLLIVAGGLGMAPLRSAVITALAHPDRYRSLTLVYGARSPTEHLFADELRVWQTSPDLRLILAVDRPHPRWPGAVGLVTECFEGVLDDPRGTVAMVCGPDVMLKACSEGLVTRGLEPGAIWVTMERNMKCGVGLCGHCQFGRFFLCKDGPVLSWDDVGALYRIPEV